MRDHRAVTVDQERELALAAKNAKALQTNAPGLGKNAKSFCKRMHRIETEYSATTATPRRKYDLPAFLATKILYVDQ